ncbi:dihydroorotate dehydrogenase electron transfer subunit [Clostridium sp. DL1XJH146]
MICTTEKIIDNIKKADGIYQLTIEGKFEGKPGQFYMLKGCGNDKLLPRPISIYDIKEESISFLYATLGDGTKELACLHKGDSLQIMGPLGNSFDEKYGEKIAIVAGGIGIAPINYLTKKLKASQIDVYAGFRNYTYGLEEIEKQVDNLIISTEDGSIGNKGYVTDYFQPQKYDTVLCCGPEIMMNKVIKMCIEKDVDVFVSTEKRMACGIGACLVCTCKTKEGNKRTCIEGPVFNGKDLVLND